MKTSIFSEGRQTACLMRAALRSAALVAALAASSLWAQPVVTTLGGGAASPHDGYVNGQTIRSLFHTPMGLALSQSGDIFVADYGNNAIRELIDLGGTGNGTTLTWATNQIKSPVGVAVDSAGNVFVLNRGGTGTTSTNGTVIEFNQYSILIATNATHLTNAVGLAMDTEDDIYVTEHSNLLVKITGGVQTTVATITAPGTFLKGITVMPDGDIAACDAGRNGIYTITPGGIVTTNAGFNGAGDGTGPANVGVLNSMAQFFQPSGIAAAGDGTLIVSDFGNGRVKVITPGADGITTNLYGVSSNDWAGSFPGWVDGTVVQPDQIGGVAGRCPFGVILSSDGTTVYTTEDFYHLVRQVTGGGFMALPPPAPTQPQDLTATVFTNSEGNPEVTLMWTANPSSQGVTNYIVERSVSATPGGPYTIIGNTILTSFTDATADNYTGATLRYVIVAQNAGGNSPNSAEAVVSIPVPPPPAPEIGYYDFEGNTETGFFSVLYPVTTGNTNVEHNPINIAVYPGIIGVSTYYLTIPPATNGTPVNNNTGSTPPVYENNQLYGSPNVNPLPTLPLSDGVVTIEAVNINGIGEASAVDAATFDFVVGNPTISGDNAAQFTLSDVTTNVIFYYTLDGTDPTNAPPSQQIGTTNGMATLSLNGSTNIFFQVRAIGFGPDAGFAMSGITPASFSTGNFQPNTISWGFAQGECSSAFVGAAGQTFYAPVTLTMLPNVPLYSMEFSMTIFTNGVGVTNPAPLANTLAFQSMLMQKASPPPGAPSGLTYLSPIPPLISDYNPENVPLANLTNYDGGTFLEGSILSGNQLAVDWSEVQGFTNLYNAAAQSLISISQAHDTTFPDADEGEPNGVIVGAYSFQIPTNAANGQQYQIQVGEASGTSDGLGDNGSGVNIVAFNNTNAADLGPGSLNSIKNVTVGSIPYLVGNVYPFYWFNAGDFGDSTLQNADVEQVFFTAIYIPEYQLAYPPAFSDFSDAMDSCGDLGILDTNPADEFNGYYTNAGALTLQDITNLYNGDYSIANQMAFGDGKLDISDVYLTFLRSQLTNNFLWFSRVWTNGVRVATAQYAPGVIPANVQPLVLGGALSAGGQLASPPPSPISITNTSMVNFTAADFQLAPGETTNIPINASVFGIYPIRAMMLNINVVPLDGSPALTVAVQFNPNQAVLGAGLASATPWLAASSGNGNYSAVWMPASPSSIMSLPGLSGTANIGTLTVTIPTNATSMSSYAINFGHASCSPSGLLSLPSRTFTGLITLSSRTNSYYNDGIPDSWRLRYFGTIYNELSVSNADADGTGMNNWQKYLAGLNPVDSTSVLNEGTDQAMAQNLQDAVIYWPSVANQTYVIKRSSNLFPPQWTSISTNTGDGTYMEIHDTSGGNNRFYEVTTP